MAEERHAAVLMVMLEVAPEDVDELNRWYEEEHRPEKMALPGYLSLRRYRAADGSPRFLALYELDDPAAADPDNAVPGEAAERMRAFMERWKHWERSVWVAQ